jgi:anthranilate synthase/aminodeoxychorismate synthase-like glutamine amidotransferase
MKILFIDNFDSFTYNLVDEFKQLNCEVKIYRNNITIEQLDYILTTFNPNLIVLSPGPSSPKEAGICIELIKKYHLNFPIFGICLGLQCMVEAFDGNIGKIIPVHGKQTGIYHNGSEILSHLPNPFSAARYHSLCAKQVPDCFKVTAHSDNIPMVIENKEYKMFGVQFHPESILTSSGSKIIKNVLKVIA